MVFHIEKPQWNELILPIPFTVKLIKKLHNNDVDEELPKNECSMQRNEWTFIPFPVDKSLHILYEFEFLKYQ